MGLHRSSGGHKYHHHHHRKSHRHKHRKGRSKKPGMETLPEMTEAEETVLDVNAKNPLMSTEIKMSTSTSGNHLDLPDGTHSIGRIVNQPAEDVEEEDPGMEDVSDCESEGIVFLVDGNKGKYPLIDHHEPYVPALPSYSDSSSHLSKYANQPVVDYREPKQLTERDKQDLFEAKRWRSFSIESAGAGGSEGSIEDPLLSSPPLRPNDTVIEIRNPWADSPSSPPRSYMSEFSSGGPRRSTKERESKF